MGGWKLMLIGAVALFAGVYVANSSHLAPVPTSSVQILAHRGLAQRFATDDLDGDTCTANIMLPPTTPYIENTIPSMEASFAAGADIIQIDVQPTSDGQFAVFHDKGLDCRTDGKGPTREHTLAELKALDIGYGYTADAGKTYPFRGKGIGLLSSLDEVLAHFPDKALFISIRSDDAAAGKLMAEHLAGLPAEQRQRLMVLAHDEPAKALQQALPDLRVITKSGLRACLQGYVAIGWTGYVPEECRSAAVFVPLDLAPWLWGFPNRFIDRMTAAGSPVYLIGAYHGGDFAMGVDEDEDFARIPKHFAGGIITNELETAVKTLRSGD
jgi:glycerophosphoryl diester phosphodiesterase